MGDLSLDWLNLVVRWVHIIAGIAWIGASFYFNWLEGNLERKGKAKGLAGDLWAVHGGGFYHVIKLSGAPEIMPKKLHWFKYEAYLTWITGMSLLSIIYYFNGQAFLLDPSKANLSLGQGISISLLAILGAWLFYHNLCKTPLVKRKSAFAMIMFGFFILAAYGLSQIFNDRAAYIQVGAMIGTIMAGNVFFVIIPSQKVLVSAAEKGEIPQDKSLGAYAGLRSLHNNYFTLPILFIMISNHYPMTFGHQYQWAVLGGLSFTSMAVRHYFNLKNKGENKVWILPVAALAMVAMALVTTPHTSQSNSMQQTEVAQNGVTDVEALAIIHQRCRTCHSQTPTDKLFHTPPNGVVFDTLEQIKAMRSPIRQRAIIAKTMPLANRTNMTDKERKTLGQWLNRVVQ